MIFHPLHTDLQPPSQMNNPFDYEPHPLCLMAAEELKKHIGSRTDWKEEVDRGKMFGVLVVGKPASDAPDAPLTLGYLAAYSGQILGRSDWEGFVPAVFDYLQPDGYFKQEEHRIDLLNAEIARREAELEASPVVRQLQQLRQEAAVAIDRKRLEMTAARQLRQLRRREGHLSEKEQQEMIRESQFLKAELHRTKKKFSDEIGTFEAESEVLEQAIEALRKQRRQRSDALQRWLFQQFVMVNAIGEHRNLLEIFQETALRVPPAGAGECCEPKLLQYAYLHGWHPYCMAMFWWGASPRQEIRHHGQFYPACTGKCKPILEWQLHRKHFVWGKGTVRPEQPPLQVIYEDSHILAVNKQAGVLTIPGIDAPVSVYSMFRERYPDLKTPGIVHRLDMDTSGILLLAKTKLAHRGLQQQFENHIIRKRYLAVLEGVVGARLPRSGTISLPLRPDLQDRPRQMVDEAFGKTAETYYEIQREEDGHTVVALYPKTGRTHQLRVHCAHADGLGCPILGDRLYGHVSAYGEDRPSRLYLHADRITFLHPASGEEMTLVCPSDF